jgi:prepilin-type N-terminal cleavage/methylation domain-containing protein
VRRRQRGFTLIEMMLGIGVFALVSVAMASSFLVGYKAISTESRTIAADVAVSEASIWLTRDLNSADAPLPAGTISSSSSISFTYGGSGANAASVVYAVDGSKNLTRTVNSGPTQVAARGITSITVAWSGTNGCYGTVTVQPSASGAAAVVLNISNRPGGCF